MIPEINTVALVLAVVLICLMVADWVFVILKVPWLATWELWMNLASGATAFALMLIAIERRNLWLVGLCGVMFGSAVVRLLFAVRRRLKRPDEHQDEEKREQEVAK